MSTATLMVHNPGSRMVTPEELEVLPEPIPKGRWHKPIPHADVVNALKGEADRRGLEIVREQWALASQDQRLFGVMEFEHTERVDGIENRWSLGIRNSNDQSVSLQGVAGTRTLVCDNLMLSGQSFVLSRKNTLHLRLVEIIKGAYDKYLVEQTRVDAVWRGLADTPITDDAAKALILDAFVKDEVAAIKYLPGVANEYLTIDHPDHLLHSDTAPRTKAGLLGSFTRAFKGIKSEVVRWEATQRAAKVFGA